jgi:isocitrate dehydrogenase (NAD+)
MTMLVSALYMLRHLGLGPHADAITAAMAAVLREGRHVTPDLGGKAGTLEMADAIITGVQ